MQVRSFAGPPVVLASLPQQRWEQYRERFVAAWAESPIGPVPGQMMRWALIAAPGVVSLRV